MKSKILSLFILTTILALALVSAADFEFTPSDTYDEITTNESVASLIFDKQYTDETDINLDIITTDLSGAISINTSAVDYNKLLLGNTYTGILTLDDNSTHNIIINPTYCTYGEVDKDKLDLSIDFEVTEGFSEEDNEWYLFDEIEVEIDVENDYSDDIDDVVIEWCLLNVNDGKCTDIEDEEPDFKLKDGDDKTIILNFRVDPDDIDEDVDADYIFIVKAYSEDTDYGEDLLCTEYSSSKISIIEDDFMVLGSENFPEVIGCGEDFTFTADLWNIADNDEEEVNIQIYSQELGMDKKITLDEVKDLDFEKITFNHKLPEDLEEGMAFFEIRVTDEDGDLYETSEDDESIFRYQVQIAGSCAGEALEPTITATLDSTTPEAIAGKQVIIKTTIMNLGDEEVTYDLSVYGNSAWSSLDSIDPQSITLGAGELKEVSIILKIDKDAEGDKEFTIKTDYNDQTTEQKIALSIEKSAVGADKIVEHLKINWFIYAIVIVNLILIIAIISVVKRMVSSNPSAI